MSRLAEALPAAATLSEQEIIARILDGQKALFEILIRRNNAYLYKVGRAQGFGHEDAKDLMQESYLGAYRALGSFEHRSSFRTWLVKILLHHCHAKWNKAGTRSEVRTNDMTENVIPLFTDDRSSTERRVHDHELRGVIETAIVRMPGDHRDVFSLRELAGLSTEETAEALAISIPNVKVRLHRAKAFLRTEVMKSYSPESLFDLHLVHCDSVVEYVMDRINVETR